MALLHEILRSLGSFYPAVPPSSHITACGKGKEELGGKQLLVKSVNENLHVSLLFTLG